MRPVRTFLGSILVTVVVVGAAIVGWYQLRVAGPFENGSSAAQRGDYPTALRFWRPLAEQGNAAAQYNLGLLYNNGLGVPQDYAEAMKWYRKSADQGNASAQHNLGLMYVEGKGVPRNYLEAARWYR